jgi:FkbM family methyltransferase
MSVISAIRAKLLSCRQICGGVRNNLGFSNGLQLNFQRLFCRRKREVIYVWNKCIRIACDCARNEHFGVQEVFIHQVYAASLDQCHFDGNRISYVDVGANIGAFNLWLSGRGMIIDNGIAAELNPTTYQRCVRNLQLNRLDSVKVANCGVGGQDGWIDFHPSADALGDNIFSGAPPSGHAGAGGANQSMQVESVTLKTLLQRYAENGATFDLLKLDCEGAEYQILRMTPCDTLRSFRYIVIEFHAEPAGESVQAAYARLREIGFATQPNDPPRFPFITLFVRQP